MSNPNKQATESSYRGDLIVAVCILITVLLVGFFFDLFGIIHDYLHRFEQWQIDEIILAFFSLSILASWFSYRRWKEAVYESGRAKRSESELNNAQVVAGIGSWHWNMLDNSEQWSDQLYRMFELAPETTPARYETFLSLVHVDDKQKVFDAVEEGKRSGSYDCEFRIVRADDSIIFVHSQAKVHFNAAGEAVSMDGTALDISNLKQTDMALCKSDQRMQSILDNTTSVIYLKDMEGKYILINKQWKNLFHVTQKWVEGKTDHDVFPEDIANAFQENDRQVIKENKVIEVEEYAPHDDGIHTYISIKFPITDENGNVYGMGGISTDITDRKEVEASLRKSNQRFRELVENIGEVFWIASPDWSDILYISPNYQLLWGRSCESLYASPMNWLDAVVDEDQALITATLHNGITDGLNELLFPEFRILHTDGTIRWIQARAFPIRNEHGELDRIVGIADNITERKQAEFELTRSHERFSSIVEMAADAIISIDEKQQIILFNKAAETMFDYDQHDVVGEHVEKLIPERFRETHRRVVEAFRDKNDVSLIHRRVGMFGLRMNGEEFPMETSISKQVFEDDTVMTVMMRDLSDQVKAEDTQRKLLMAIGEAGEAVIITDRNAVIEYVNPAFTEITGYAADEAIGNTPAMLKSEAQNPKFYAELWQTITSGNVWHGTLIDRKKDGSFYPALMSVSPIRGENEEITHYVSLQQDMTEYKKMEEQFLQAQKMEAVGTLVGGIAHDFNNMLAAMQGNSYLARARMNKGEISAADEKIGNIEQIIFSAAEMVKQLLTFARKDSVSMTDLALKPYLKEALKLGGSAIPESIELATRISDEGLHIYGDSTQLQQLLMNLLNNARDAVSGVSEPKITVCLSRFVPEDHFLLQHPEQSGAAMALLSIADNGSGISKTNLQKVFEPFFTTKGVGKGTGLGLAMVFGAVQRHGGVIEVESSIGEGTTFNIYLPLVTGSVEETLDLSSKMNMGMNETILLVDDEEVLRSTTSELLSSIGYRVLEAENGQEALQRFTENHNEIAIIITDIVMPKMGGVELVEEVRRIQGDMPIIFVTGYDKDRALSVSQGIDCSIVLNKPFNIEYLSQSIRQLID